jgi:hypothetical protein
MNKSFSSRAFSAGLLVGTLDLLAASVQFYIKTGKDPLPVLKYIASGVFGAAASSGGTMMAVWGLLLHYFIALSFTFLFFLLVKQFHSLLKYPVPAGIVYGVFIWSVMRFIVLPLSHVKMGPLVLKDAAIAAAILVACIGLPLAFLAKRILKKYG